MTTLARITITLILAILFSSCGFDINIGPGKKGNGIVEEEKRRVTSDFTAISVSEGLDAYVTQGNDFEIIVEADENIIGLIGTDIKNGTLRIHAIENIGRATKSIYVTLPVIIGLETSSGAALSTKNAIEAENIELSSSSGSNLQIEELKAYNVIAESSSGAHIRVAGETETFNGSASSGSGIKAENLSSANCSASASSGAGITVNASESLIAKASSGGEIRYTGNAKVEHQKSSSGSVSAL
ncbi:putative autotransporter adhesin-like protein [Arenibacter algicola]|uniref:Autotransporter adhesin-like protein n=1 Tax=Arenibacter algicola TaxID=616991 RepID=A0ABY3A9Q1_9FLAO